MNALAGLRPQPYAAFAYEAFILGAQTRLLDPLAAGSLQDALAETATRWSWDRGDRLALREIGEDVDRLHVYEIKCSRPQWVHAEGEIMPRRVSDRYIVHVATIDLNVIAGRGSGLVGAEVALHQRRQAQRPEGAR